MLHTMVMVALCATSSAAEPVKLASPGFNAVNVDANLATFFSDHFAQQLTLNGIRVLTASEITAIVGFERQKEMLGCNENSASCMAELANALGVDGLIVGSIARFDTTYQVNLKIIGSANAVPLSVFSAQAEGDKGMLSRLNDAAKRMAKEVLQKLGRTAASPVATGQPSDARDPSVAAAQSDAQVTEAGPGRRWPLVPSIVGGVLVAGGGVSLWRSFEEVRQINQSTDSLDQVRSRRSLAGVERVAGYALVTAGAAALIYSGVAFATSGDEPQVAVTPLPGGASVGIAGVLP